MKGLDRYRQLRNRYKSKLIIHPIMTGGILGTDVQRKLNEEEWIKIGYSVCYDCLEGRSGLISKPPIRDFLKDIAEFFGGDLAEHTFGCRAAQFSVAKTISGHLKDDSSKDYANILVVDSLCHYTTIMAAEMNGLRVVEVPNNGYPEYRIEAEDYAKKIEEIKEKTGKLPGLIMATHVEPHYGNLNPVKDIGRIAGEYNIPYMINGAYTAGILPLSIKNLKADFLTASAHKSMASLGPLGFVVTQHDWEKRLFQKSSTTTDWSGRSFEAKAINIFGCSVGGTPLISSMYSFPNVVERVRNWDEELRKTCWLAEELEKLDGVKLLGTRPHRHHLIAFETPIFWEISKHHKRKGFFLAEEMIKRGIVGLHKGLSKHMKFSVYGLNWDQVRLIRDSFNDIAEEFIKKFDISLK
ncbi:MAG: O-phospho-L-seryl-tRNA:Cys-tRNA synthase [Candidatus Hodarchaeota archaeon]